MADETPIRNSSPGRAAEFPGRATTIISSLDAEKFNRLEQIFILGLAMLGVINATDASKVPTELTSFKRVLDFFMMHVAAMYRQLLEAKVTLN